MFSILHSAWYMNWCSYCFSMGDFVCSSCCFLLLCSWSVTSHCCIPPSQGMWSLFSAIASVSILGPSPPVTNIWEPSKQVKTEKFLCDCEKDWQVMMTCWVDFYLISMASRSLLSNTKGLGTSQPLQPVVFQRLATAADNADGSLVIQRAIHFRHQDPSKGLWKTYFKISQTT